VQLISEFEGFRRLIIWILAITSFFTLSETTPGGAKPAAGQKAGSQKADARRADAQKPAPGTMYTQGPEGSCAILGAAGVPVCLTTSRGVSRGLYLTRVGQDGIWHDMGLIPGDVLLTLDNKVVRSAADAETYLSGMKPHSIDFQYMHKSDAGQYGLKTARYAYSGGSARPSASAYSSSSSSSASGTGNSSIAELESHMLDLVNRDRRNVAHVNALPMDSRLSYAARNYAQDMLKRNFFSHTDPSGKGTQERAREAGIRCGIYENLSFQQGRGFRTDKEMVAAAEAEMMSEPPEGPNHRTNILHANHSHVGIGVARDGNTIIMVQWYTDQQP
jgi:uncharacterized protein YkwD